MAATKTVEAEKGLDKTKLYTVIGHSITRWAILESELCGLFCACFDPNNSAQPFSAFWAIISFEAKLKMTNEVISQRFRHKPKILSEWTTLKNALISRSKVRNKIAHGAVISTNWHRGPLSKSEIYLVPFFFARMLKRIPSHADTLKPGYDHRPSDRMYLRDIEQATASFDATARKIIILNQKAELIARREALRELAASIRDRRNRRYRKRD